MVIGKVNSNIIRAASLAVAMVGTLGISGPVLAEGEDGATVATSAPLTSEVNVLAANPGIAAAPTDGKISKGLDLTDDQKEKIYNLKNKLADAVGPKRAELQSQERKLRDLLTQPTIDRSQIQGVQSKINSLRDDISNLKIAFKMDFSEQLTADQREKLRYHHARRGMHRGGMKFRAKAPAQS